MDLSLKNLAKQSMSASWYDQLQAEFDRPYCKDLQQFLAREIEQNQSVFPPSECWFNAFQGEFEQSKVVILGQDPYHGVGQAHGLSFSVRPGVRIPPSLANIYKELNTDLGMSIPSHGYLKGWADQGVLLLNATLSVAEGQAFSHQKKGWEKFTDQVIKQLDQNHPGLIFMLWGSHAQKKASLIISDKHLILKAPHPSPLSAYRGFFGCRHFSQANKHLRKLAKKEIIWSQIP